MQSKSTRQITARRLDAGQTSNHGFVSLEHLLHAVCMDESGIRLLHAVGADTSALQRDIESFLQRY